MLEHTYGSLEFAPTIITGNIVEKEGGSMTKELRGRLRYLQHLPVTCQFEVAEITLSESIVSRETMNYFKGNYTSFCIKRFNVNVIIVNRKNREIKRVFVYFQFYVRYSFAQYVKLCFAVSITQ